MTPKDVDYEIRVLRLIALQLTIAFLEDRQASKADEFKWICSDFIEKLIGDIGTRVGYLEEIARQRN